PHLASTSHHSLSLHDALPISDSISIVIDRGGSAALVWTDQGTALNGPTHITYSCVTAQQSAIVGAKAGTSCRGPDRLARSPDRSDRKSTRLNSSHEIISYAVF